MLTSDLLLYAFKILNRLYSINQMFCALESHGIWSHQSLSPALFAFATCKSEGPRLKKKSKTWAPTLPAENANKNPSGEAEKLPLLLSLTILSPAPIQLCTTSFSLHHERIKAGSYGGVQARHLHSEVSQASLKPTEMSTDLPKTKWHDYPRASFLLSALMNGWVGKTKQLTLQVFHKGSRAWFPCLSLCCRMFLNTTAASLSPCCSMEESPQEREMLSLPELEGSSTWRTAQAAEGAEHLPRDTPGLHSKWPVHWNTRTLPRTKLLHEIFDVSQ